MHSSQCSINHTGSAERMEKDGATEIFLRREIFFGDGYTGCFGSVKEACINKFGDV